MPASEKETSAEKRQDNGGAQGLVFAQPILLPAAPWHVDPDDRPGMEWNNHILSADGNTVCFMAHNPDDNTALENAARLIAAAPSLLEALRQFAQLPLPSEMHAADDWHSTMDRHLHVILTDAIRAARSAIQRAEGVQ